MTLEDKKRRAGHLVDLKQFIGSSVHQLFIRGTQNTIKEIEENILNQPVFDLLKDGPALIELKAQRAVLISELNFFEEAATTLENEIEAELDGENET